MLNEFWKRIEESMNTMYDRGFQAGVNAQRLSDHEAQNHRLEDMLHRGKEIGFNEGFTDGYKKRVTKSVTVKEKWTQRPLTVSWNLTTLWPLKTTWRRHWKNETCRLGHATRRPH